MQHIDKIAVLEEVAAAWNRAGITYAVAHGIDGYPATVGRDIDVLIRADQVAAGLTIAEHVLVAHGFTVIHPPPLWGARLLASHNADWDSVWIEIHTLTQLSWRNVRLADTPHPSEHWGPFQVDPWVSFSKRILHPLLDGDTQRYADRPGEWTLYKGEHDVVPPVLRSLCGAELAQQLCQALVVGNPSLAAPLVPRLKRALMGRTWAKAPVTSLRSLGNAVRRKLVRLWAPTTPVVALVGPNGVDKSAILCNVATVGDRTAPPIIVRHWQPGVLPRLGRLAGMSAPAPGPDGLLVPRCVAGSFHWLRLCYYLLDYAVGHIKDRIDSSVQRVVLYDRYALDMVVDPLRFGLHEARAAWPLKHFTPKPDLVILLYDTPERIHARKPELAPSDIQQQLQHWFQLADEGKVDAVIFVDAPPEQVAERIKALIMDALIAKNESPTPATAS